MPTVKKINSRRQKHNAGFTLIEMSVCIIIIGFLTIPLIRSYFNGQKSLQIETTRENVRQSASEIAAFTTTGRLPCPSNRALSPSDANYGRELGIAGDPTAAQIAAIPACTGAAQGICRTAGARDTDADADSVPDPVLIGGIPTEALRDAGSGLTVAKTFDAWGGQLTYAVSAHLCQSPIDPTNRIKMHTRGVIRAVDENDNPTAGIGTRELDVPPDGALDPDALFVLLSHGEAGIGGYTREGSLIADCEPATLEGENCNNDFTFRAALNNSKASDNSYFDDIVYFHLAIQNTLWEPVGFINAGGQYIMSGHMRNLNDGNTGILTETPTQKLHVNGNLRAASTNTAKICDRSGGLCFDYDFLKDRRTADIVTPSNPNPSKRNTCGNGQVLLKLGNNTVECGNPVLQAPGVEKKCSGSTPYLRGILSNGDLICTN